MPPAAPASIDRATADDVLNLAVDHGRVPMVIGALLVLDPAHRPPADLVRAALVRRAAAVPRLTQRLVRAPVAAGRPVWVDAGAAAVADLVDAVPVELGTDAVGPGAVGPATGGPGGTPVPRALLDATAELVTTRIDHDRPLWRARLLLDRSGGVAGVAVTAHHVLADGMAGLAVLAALSDDAEPGASGEAAGGVPTGSRSGGRPSWAVLARDAWARRLRAVRALPGAARRVGGGAHELGLQRPRLADPCSLLGRTGDRRRLELATTDLEAVRAAARAAGATVNDVVVTAVTGALVELLDRRGEAVGELVVSVPVSRRAQGEAAGLGNATGVVPVRVPGTTDAPARLAALVAERGRVRGPGRGRSAALLTPAFRALAAVGAFQAFIDRQRLVHTFVTNVRGPQQRLRLAGAEVVAVVPVAVNPGNVAVSFDVLSYAGTLGVTLVCDPALVPESAWLADRVTAGLTASG